MGQGVGDAVNADEQRLYARMMEVFAGFLTHTDYHIGRLIAGARRSWAISRTR